MKSLPAILAASAIVAITGIALSVAPAAQAQDRDHDRGGPYSNVQQLGYQDGIRGAQADFGNHRPPTPENRDEFRHPHVAAQLRDAYRDAFRRGYREAAARLWGPSYSAPAPPPQQYGDRDRDRDRDGDGDRGGDWGMRGLRSDAERRGYSEGAEEARRDFQFRRRGDADDHDEYRNPPVPPPLADEYREGFMRGYTVAWSQLNGDAAWHYQGDPDQWAPPDRFNDIERRGFRDGVIGAQRDYGNHRRPDPANRDEYRHPNMPPPMWHEYREGFRRGYEMAVMRLWGGQ